MNDKEILETANLISENLPAIPKAINNLIELIVGNWLEHKNSLSKEKFKYKLKEKISQIPKDKIIEPKLSIIGPALDSCKYYIEEEEIREMFTNLISASMNSDYSKEIHHSFVEIIKQLSPLDAVILKELENQNPILDIQYEFNFKKTEYLGLYSGNQAYLVYENLFFTENIPEAEFNKISLDNLIKQGLIKINKNVSLNKEKYSHYNNSKTLLEIKQHSESKEPPFDKKDGKISLIYNVVSLTSLGELFKKVCIR